MMCSGFLVSCHTELWVNSSNSWFSCTILSPQCTEIIDYNSLFSILVSGTAIYSRVFIFCTQYWTARYPGWSWWVKEERAAELWRPCFSFCIWMMFVHFWAVNSTSKLGSQVRNIQKLVHDIFCRLHLFAARLKSEACFCVYVHVYMYVCVELAFAFLATSLTFFALWREEWQLSEWPLQFQGGSQLAVNFPSSLSLTSALRWRDCFSPKYSQQFLAQCSAGIYEGWVFFR